MAEAAPYPVTFEVLYPERLSRLSTFFRLLLFIPVAIFWAVVGAAVFSGTAGAVAVASWLAILVRGRIPRWLFDFQVALYRWSNRALAYLLLLVDRYPPFEGDWAVSYDVRYPERLARWKLLFWKFITAIPHFIILSFLGLGVIFVSVIAWFFILIAGRYPRGLYDYVGGVMRWNVRVQGYVLSLTDEYPPFNLSAGAGAAGGDAYLIGSVLGFLLAAGAIAGGIVFAVVAHEELVVQEDYQDLQAGESSGTVQIGDVMVALVSVSDPLSPDETLLEPESGRRLVMFEFSVANGSGRDIKIERSDFKVWDEDGRKHRPELVVVAGRPATQHVEEDRTARVDVVFEVPEGTAPTQLKYWPSFGFRKSIKYVFR